MPPVVISKDHQHFLFDRKQPPAATVRPGARVIFETLDACCGEVRSVGQLMRRRAADRPSNPICGPVFVEGAEPGHTLVAEILGIELDPEGFQLIGPRRAIIRQEVPDWTCYVFRTAKGRVRFPNGMAVAADPVVGQFGNAPAGAPTSAPNLLGGNLDVPAARVGAKLYLPVEVRGALFSLGDIHARQGDGEVVGAPEIGARVTVRLERLRRRHAEGVMIEDATHWHTPRSAETEHEAARLATLANGSFIARTQNVAFKDALILLTLIGKLSLARTGQWGAHGPVVCSSFSKQALARALVSYQRKRVKPAGRSKGG